MIAIRAPNRIVPDPFFRSLSLFPFSGHGAEKRYLTPFSVPDPFFRSGIWAIIRHVTAAEEINTTKLICPLTCATVAEMKAAAAAAAEEGADMAEFRVDFLENLPGPEVIEEMVGAAPLPAIVTCRPAREGGRYTGDEVARLDLLRRASDCGAIVDLEADVPDAERPAGTVIRSTHFFDGVPENIENIVAALDGGDGDIAKIAFAAGGPEDALLALELVGRCTKPAIALAMGEAGVASRILAARHGAWGTFAALAAGRESAPGQPTLEAFRERYRHGTVGKETRLFGVVGCPVGHSMSPAIHNAAFDATGFDGVYVPLLVQPGKEHFERFMAAGVCRPGSGWRGLSVTIPHKQNALAFVGQDRCDELAVRIGAVNTITIEPDGSLRGGNTDYAAAIDALTESMNISRADLAGRRVAVLGAGGVARAVVAGLTHCGADITIYNRTFSRAETLAGAFGCGAEPIDRAGATDAEIVINCTALGMHPNTETTPLPTIPPSIAVVFDTVYNPVETRLLGDAAAAGRVTVSGVDMFVNQAAAQYREWTGNTPPWDLMRDVVLARLTGGS